MDAIAMSRFAHRSALVLSKYSPIIMTGIGVVGSIGATVLACKATPKAIVVADDLKKGLEATNEVHELWKLAQEANEPLEVNGKIIEYDSKTRVVERTLYIRTAVFQWLKVYAVPLAIGAVSLGLIVSGQKIMWTRNVAITAAFETMKTSFDKYRENIRELTDAETDRLALGGNAPSAIVVTGDETNPIVQAEHDLNSPASLYCRWFDESNPNFDSNAETNKFFLLTQQSILNDLLRTQGHVFLNEVYDRLGFKRTPAGARCGWIWNGDGDNEIDFGIWKQDEHHMDFVNAWSKSVLLDFNVDGDIHSLI